MRFLETRSILHVQNGIGARMRIGKRDLANAIWKMRFGKYDLENAIGKIEFMQQQLPCLTFCGGKLCNYFQISVCLMNCITW